MEDIEYLEEYEDLVLPALNSAAAEAAASSVSFETNTNQLHQKNNNEADDSSSSLDQDIFNCLFDDNSDDEDYNDYQNSGNTVIEKVEITRQDTPKKLNIPKTVNKTVTSITKPAKSCMSKTSGTTVPLSVSKEEISGNKTKSVATVRPTVQSQLTTNLSKKTNISARQPTLASSSSATIKRQKPSTSGAGKTYRTIRFPVVPPKKPPSSTASSPIPANNFSNKSPAGSSVTSITSSTLVRNIKHPAATIVRPEKIVSKDPTNDPLDLEHISEADSDSSFSDISGETYNTISDLDEDDSNDEFYSGEEEFYEDEDYEPDEISNGSHIIELSNDSSGAPSKLEEIRAPTPYPVISEDSDTAGSSTGFILSRKQSIKPYSHPAIIESVLRKGAKPKLLELLQAFNLLEDSVESSKEDNIVIDITTSRENLVENTDTDNQQQQVTSSNEPLLPSTTIIIDPANLTVDNNKSLTLNTPNLEQTLSNSKKTNKKKKKKNLTNMDANDYSTDSDLSAVEELLEESYAEAMKRVNSAPIASQGVVAAEIVIGRQQENAIIEENKEKLPKADVVIDYDDKKSKEINENKAENAAGSLKEENRTTPKEDNPLDKESKNLENVTNEQETSKEPTKTDIGASVSNSSTSKVDLKIPSVECPETVTVDTLDVANSNINDSSINRKKKRFRNLTTPDPIEKSSDEAKSVDDLTDFKGFDEETTKIKEQKLVTKEKSQSAKDVAAKAAEMAKILERGLRLESFKSPGKTHQSVKDKSKESKSKSSRESSSDSREKSSRKHSKNKSSSDSFKDRSSRESSRDKSSRESSKDRSRDRLKHSSRDKDRHSKKHHHRDPRRSCDSKGSSKSRESSKSRDSKETRDLSKNYSSKKDQSLHNTKEISSEIKNVEKKVTKENEKDSTENAKSSSETKSSSKELDHKKDSKHHKKSSSEKSDKKSFETKHKSSQSEKEVDKTPNKSLPETKSNKSMTKSSTVSSSSSSRGSSKDRKSTNKTVDSNKSEKEINQSEKPKVTTDPNKSSKSKSNTTTTTTDKVENDTEQQKTLLKCSSENVDKDKVIATTSDNDTTFKDTTERTALKDSENSSAASNTSKIVQSISKGSNTPLKSSESEAENKNENASATNKTDSLQKTDSSHKTKVPQSKEAAAAGVGSATKSESSEIKNTHKLSPGNIQNTKTPVKSDDVKSKATASDSKNSKQDTVKNLKDLDSKLTPKRSQNSKHQEIKNAKESIKVEKLQDSKVEKPAKQKSKDKTNESNVEGKEAKNTATVSETKIDSRNDEREVKVTKGNEAKTQNDSDKQPNPDKLVTEKDEPKNDSAKTKEVNEENSSKLKPSAATTNKSETKKETANVKQNQNKTEKKESTKSETPSSKAQKISTEKLSQKKTEFNEQNPANTSMKKVPTKTKNPSTQTAKPESSDTNSATLTENAKPKQKFNSRDTSSKTTPKKSQSTASKTKSESFKKTVPKPQSKTQHTKTDIAEENKKEADVAASKKPPDIANIEDIKSNDVKQKETENFVEQTQLSQTNIIDSNLMKIENSENDKQTQNTEENSLVSKNKAEDDDSSSTECSKTKRLMEIVSKKSVVILIEPLQPIQHYLGQNNEIDAEIESRKQKSHNESIKQNDDSIENEDQAKEKCTEITETEKKARQTSSEFQLSDNNNRNKTEQIVYDDIEQATTEGKSPSISDLKVADSKEKCDKKVVDKECSLAREKIDLAKSGNHEMSLKGKENLDQHSEAIKTTEASKSCVPTESTTSEIDNKNIESEENRSCDESDFEPKTEANKLETETKDKNDDSVTLIKSPSNSDLTTESENKATKSADNVKIEKRSDERTQSRKKVDSKSQPSNKAEPLAKEISATKTEKYNAETRKPNITTDSASQEAPVDGDNADGMQTRTKIEKAVDNTIKTREKTDKKAEIKKSDTKVTEYADAKLKKDKQDYHFEPSKKRTSKNVTNKSEKIDICNQKTEDNIEPIKTRHKAELKMESKNSNVDAIQGTPNLAKKKNSSKSKSEEISDEKKESSECKSESVKTRQKTTSTTNKTEILRSDKKLESDPKKEVKLTEICDEKTQEEESNFEAIATTQKIDLKREANKAESENNVEKHTKICESEEVSTSESFKTTQKADSTFESKVDVTGQNKTIDPCDFSTPLTKSEMSLENNQATEIELEPRRTRSRIDQKCELETGKSKTYHKEISAHNETKDSKKPQRKTINCDDEKLSNQKETKNKEEVIEQSECDNIKEIIPEEPAKETITTRRRGNLKDDEKLVSQSKEEQNSDHKDSETIRTRSRADVKAENDKCKTELPQVQALDSEKQECGKEKEKSESEKVDTESAEETNSAQKDSETIRTRSRADLKAESDKVKTELLQINAPDNGKNEYEKGRVTPIKKTRKRGDFKEITVKEKIEEIGEHKEPQMESEGDNASELINSKLNPESKEEDVIDKNQLLQDEKAIQETEHLSTPRKQMKDEIKSCGQKASHEASLESGDKKSEGLAEEKHGIQEEPEVQQQVTPRKTRRRLDVETEAADCGSKNATERNVEPTCTKEDAKETSKDVFVSANDLKHKELTHSAESKPSSSQSDKNVSTADKQQTETASTDEAKRIEAAEESVSIRIISEIDKICQESSENEMSGFESSSSGTDHTLRRNLRKRGMDSPFSENENIKKHFKEPSQKPVAHLTPKSSKPENIIPNLSSSSAKRLLRSPALEIETQSPSKKPKLVLTKKSTRFRISKGRDDLEGEELTAIPTKSDVTTKEQPQVTTGRKTAQSEKPKEAKDNTKNIVLLEKKFEEKFKELTEVHTSLNTKIEENVNNESIKLSIKSRVNVGKITESPTTAVQSKTSKSKQKTTPNPSQELDSSSTQVLSFTDWLKNKNQNTTVESDTANEDAADNLARSSRGRPRIKTKSTEVLQTGPEKPTMTLQAPEKATDGQPEIAVAIEPQSEIMKAAQHIANSSLQTSANQLKDGRKKQKSRNRHKKANVKRLQSSISRKQKPMSTTPPRSKKSEIAMLIESMSKEMKDGGITDLLNTQIQVKRQRLPNTKNLSMISLIPTKETRTLAAAIAQLPNDMQPQNMNASNNLEYKSKSPTRRKAHHSVGKPRRSIPISHTPFSNRDSIFTPNITAITDKGVPKTGTTTTTTTEIKTRKSMPAKTSESSTYAKHVNVPSRKSLANSKQQSQGSAMNAFKLPKTTGPSILLNNIPTPTPDNIKTLYADDKQLSDSRVKTHQTDENLLKKFNCRKLFVRLDRTVVQNYLTSANKRRKQTSKGKKGTSSADANAVKIIQNKSETNLRIQSVLDASTFINTSASSSIATQAVHKKGIDSTTNSQNSINAPVETSSNPCILPSANNTGTALAAPLLTENFELKNELEDESPTGGINEEILPDTPTLLARAQTITEAAHQALSNSATPTDIRLLPTDSTGNNSVPSFGVTPTVLDNRGTCMYTFLHPAKYNRNHSNVLLDYCCPNLDGPMPAIDPTRIHAQVQVPVVELPASIVLTTKVVTRADLESGDTTIPAIIRKKAEKIRKNMATHHKMAVSTVNTLSSNMTPSSIASITSTLPPTINALTKQLPSTTTITAKIRPSLPPQQSQMIVNQSSVPPPASSGAVTKSNIVSVIPKGNISQMSAGQESSLRSNLRRFDGLLKQLVQPYESLSFVERHRIIEAVMASGKCTSQDLEQTLVLMEEYLKQTMLLKNDTHGQPVVPPVPATMSTNNYSANLLPPAQMPQLQPSPKILASKATSGTATSYCNQFEQTVSRSVRKVPSRIKTVTAVSADAILMKQRQQVPIYDIDRNIIGYQMHMMNPMSAMPAYTKSTMSSHTGAIMSTSPDTSVGAYKINRRSLKRPAQDSPRVFYTKPPLQTSTPKGATNSSTYLDQHAKTANTTAQKSQHHGSSIVTTVRTAGSSSSAGAETITTTTTATVKRVTRSTATGSKIIIVSKSNQSSEETILPDANSNHEQTEIKHENDIEDFLG